MYAAIVDASGQGAVVDGPQRMVEDRVSPAIWDHNVLMGAWSLDVIVGHFGMGSEFPVSDGGPPQDAYSIWHWSKDFKRDVLF